MKNLFLPLMMVTALVTTACTNTKDDVINEGAADKTAISFSVEESHAPMTRAGFATTTKIAMRIKSENGTDARYTRTIANANAAKSGDDYSAITTDAAYVRYWDDAFGRQAKISVFAIAVPGKTDVSNDGKTLEEKLTVGTGTWFEEATENEKISWKVATAQTAETLVNEDLTYSNNISKDGKGGVYRYDFENSKYPDYSNQLADGCMAFRLQNATETDGPGKFDKGHLVFNHALSRITVNLIKGAGFADGSFHFATGTNVKVLDMPTEGTLNLSDGNWSGVTKCDISMMAAQTASTGVAYSLMAQLIPGNVISSTATDNVLDFIIDDNEYFITQKHLYEALKSATGMTKKDANGITMEPGLNYVFNINVNKTGISQVTATVQKWTDVNAAAVNPDNARISITGVYDSQSGEASTGFALYRALDESPEISDTYVGKNWNGDYEGPATLTKNSDGSWKTNWYFESNKAYYHFRTMKGASSIVTTAAQDYFDIASGTTDYHWGAPMTAKPEYDVEKGYEEMLLPAVGASSDKLNITEMHIMSSLEVALETPTTDDKVDLSESKVYITNFAKDGTVLMGTGKVIPSTGMTAKQAINGSSTAFTYIVVPQSLVHADGDYVGLTIETKDGNQYVIKNLSTTLVSGSTTETIARWLPGHHYKYVFKLTKAGINKITCTVQGWVDVTAANQNISLEN